jgi:hypothetical protein
MYFVFLYLLNIPLYLIVFFSFYVIFCIEWILYVFEHLYSVGRSLQVN